MNAALEAKLKKDVMLTGKVDAARLDWDAVIREAHIDTLGEGDLEKAIEAINKIVDETPSMN
jgi:hypothetical protein